MSKAVVVIAAVALIFVVGAPPVIGALTELGLRRHAETIETIPETPYRLDVVDYEGGWFGSTARVEARLTDAYLDQVIAAATQGEDETAAAVARLTMQVFLGQSLPLEVEIGHGPVFIDGGVRVGIVSTVIRPDPATAGMPELLQSLGMPYLFEARTVTTMNGDTRFVVEIPAVEFQARQGQLAFSGLDLAGKFDLSARAVESAGVIDFVRADGGVQGSVDAADVTFDSDVTRYDSGLWLGDVGFEIGTLRVDGYGFEGPFSIDLTRAGAAFDSELDASGELVTMTGGYYVDSLAGDGLADLDGQIALADARFDASLRSFSLEALHAYYEYSRLVSADPRSAPPLIPGIQDMLYLTLSTSPEIQIGPIEFVWDGEPFAASATIYMDASGLPARQEFDMLDLRTLLDAVSVSAYTDMSEPMAQTLVEQAAIYQLRSNAAAMGNEIPEADLESMAEKQAIVMLLGLVSQGMLVSTADGYHGELLFQDRELTINGNFIPLPIPVF